MDHDTVLPGGARLVRLTPPGSKCSITTGTVGPSSDSVAMAPGSLQGVQLVVADVRASRRALVERGVRVGGIEVFDGGALRPYLDGDALENVGFLRFSDPDGYGGVVQQIFQPGRREVRAAAQGELWSVDPGWAARAEARNRPLFEALLARLDLKPGAHVLRPRSDRGAA